MVTISEETKRSIRDLVEENSLILDFYYNENDPIGGISTRSNRTVNINGKIDKDRFEYQFSQIGQNYSVDEDQDMFMFNAFHEIGHFVLNKWVRDSGDKTINRIANLEIDKAVNDWAYEAFQSWKLRH